MLYKFPVDPLAYLVKALMSSLPYISNFVFICGLGFIDYFIS